MIGSPCAFPKKEHLDPIHGERLVGELREIVREPLPERRATRVSRNGTCRSAFPRTAHASRGSSMSGWRGEVGRGVQAAGLGVRLARPRAVCLRRNSS